MTTGDRGESNRRGPPHPWSDLNIGSLSSGFVTELIDNQFRGVESISCWGVAMTPSFKSARITSTSLPFDLPNLELQYCQEALLLCWSFALLVVDFVEPSNSSLSLNRR